MRTITIQEISEGVVKINLNYNTVLCQNQEIFDKIIQGKCQIQLYNGIINYPTEEIKQNKNNMKEIKMQFSVGEKVYLMSDNKVVEGEILSRTYNEDKKTVTSLYEVRIGKDNFSNHHSEEKLFKTKQELLNSL